MFISESILRRGSWQSFERAVGRLLLYEKFEDVRLVGQTGDRGADLLAHKLGKRWLFQVKRWKQRIGPKVVDETLEAMRLYKADVPVIVALSGFDYEVEKHQRVLLSRGIPLQLWDSTKLIQRAEKLPENTIILKRNPKGYQEDPIKTIVKTYTDGEHDRALIVMATGLGKTFVACESIRRIKTQTKLRVLVITHQNPLLYQIEKAFWPFLTREEETLIWNGLETPTTSDLERAPFAFACVDSLYNFIKQGGELPPYDIVLIDECHHVGGQMYLDVLEHSMAGQPGGPFLMGLTATPWRPDEVDIKEFFGEPLVCIDIVTGLNKGFLSNVDYRIYTDNINWEALPTLRGNNFTPRQINRTLFINQWDDAVVYELQSVWKEQKNPKAIVFCGTIDHAITMRDRINALGFCNASAIYSETVNGKVMSPLERNRILCDFHDGTINVVCAVDIFNEGIDVPDVNIIVFQRVTHSRRIFVQQLGRGLRITDDKEKVIVLDFVSDIRRFAAGIDLKDRLEKNEDIPHGQAVRLSLPHKVTFKRVGAQDPQAESFLRQWLEDVAAIEDAGEDTSVLKFPPFLQGGRA